MRWVACLLLAAMGQTSAAALQDQAPSEEKSQQQATVLCVGEVAVGGEARDMIQARLLKNLSQEKDLDVRFVRGVTRIASPRVADELRQQGCAYMLSTEVVLRRPEPAGLSSGSPYAEQPRLDYEIEYALLELERGREKRGKVAVMYRGGSSAQQVAAAMDGVAKRVAKEVREQRKKA